jgi:hypothetical protein
LPCAHNFRTNRAIRTPGSIGWLTDSEAFPFRDWRR